MFPASPHARRRAIGLVLTVGLLLAAVTTVAAVDGRHDRPHPAVMAASPARSTSQPGAPTDPLAPVTPPPDVTVDSFDGAQLPVSRTAGPLHVEAGLASGFATTPRGAAFAALHLALRASPDAGPAVYRPTIAHQVAGDATAYLTVVEADYATDAAKAGVAPGQPLPSTAVPAGWRVDVFSATQPTTVHLLLGSTGSPLLVDVPVSLLLVGGDWQLLPPPSGRFTGSPVASPIGYASFSP